jgi:hypothetical protein
LDFFSNFQNWKKKIIDKIAKSQHMIQVGNQMFFFSFHIFLIAEIGWISLWMITTSTTSQIWKIKHYCGIL